MSKEPQKYDSDNQEDKFEDAVEEVASQSTTDSDDTEKLTKDFEILQLSGEGEDSESRESTSPSSTASWQKCESDEGQSESKAPKSAKANKEAETPKAAGVSTTDEPIAHCSHDIPENNVASPEPQEASSTVADATVEKDKDLPEPKKDSAASSPGDDVIPVPGPSLEKPKGSKPKTVKTSAEWKEIVEKYKMDRQMNEKLREICKNIEALRTKPKPKENALLEDDSSSEESDSDDDEEMTDEDVAIRNKIDELTKFMHDNSVLVAAVQETKLTRNSGLTASSYYTILRCDRDRDKGGGLAFVIHSSYDTEL